MLDFSTLRLRWRPNQYLVCPRERCAARPHREAPVFDADPDRLEAAILAVVGRQPRVEQLEGDPVERAYEFVQRSRVFKFPDFVSIHIWPVSGGRSTVGIYSRAKYGFSDMGVNRRRVEAWLRAVERELRGARRGR